MTGMYVNPNDYVWVRLTDAGLKFYRDDATEWNKKHPQCGRRNYPDLENGWYKTQFWHLMNLFGNTFSLGGSFPFMDMCFEQPTKPAGEPQ